MQQPLEQNQSQTWLDRKSGAFFGLCRHGGFWIWDKETLFGTDCQNGTMTGIQKCVVSNAETVLLTQTRVIFHQKMTTPYRGCEIDCSGLPAGSVLAALYNHAKPVGLGMLHYRPAPMTVEEAEKHLKKLTGFDYLFGRPIKIDFRAYPILDTKWYDRDQGGEGTANKIIQKLKQDLQMKTSVQPQQKVQTPSSTISQVKPESKLSDSEMEAFIIMFSSEAKDSQLLFLRAAKKDCDLKRLVDFPDIKPFDKVHFCKQVCEELQAEGIKYPFDWHMFLSKLPGDRYEMIGSLGGRFVVDGTCAIVKYMNYK